MAPTALTLDPDRLLPADPGTREIARELFAQVEHLPIVSPHGHVPAEWLADDEPFADPTNLLLSPDHYVTRLLHASGVDLAAVGVGGSDVDARAAWRVFCERWPVFAGTASAGWLEHVFAEVFGIAEAPSAGTADALFDALSAALATDAFRPRALFDRFRIAALATTDDPLDALDGHRRLAEDPSFHGRVLPTFRPDRYLDPAAPAFTDDVARLADAQGRPVDDFRGYLESLAERRAHFIARGAVSADHGVPDAYTTALDEVDAASLYRRAVRGELSSAEARELRGHMLVEMARMSIDDGLVMTLHPGVLRGHNTATHETFGPDSGHDIPVAAEFTRNLRPLLERFGLVKDFHLVLFTIDETAYSREIAPLAGFYPSVFIGAPWWFLDAPDAIGRFRSAVTETAGFSRGSGFIDDTRAFLSIPARHDVARRCDAGFLARYVAEGRITRERAREIIVDITDRQPREVFKL
ncbi:glucuronate isomerase [Microbacterium karelineae]|uniref:glucuronate isomerase n=1 Tax=Microbacterium karelineae TaxID=2654283 RepID=UPI0012EAA930|nr:glucuronate isomerase [Microbacterium karelineae]